MKNVVKKDKVKTICYGKERSWDYREDAIDFFADGVLNSEGAEQQRYLKVLVGLTLGKKTCKDTDK